MFYSLDIERLLISRHVKLTNEEEKEFISFPETSLEYHLAKCQRTENYSPFDNT